MENDLSNKSEELTTLTQEKGELMVTDFPFVVVNSPISTFSFSITLSASSI
jgi:hypothetical protein